MKLENDLSNIKSQEMIFEFISKQMIFEVLAYLGLSRKC